MKRLTLFLALLVCVVALPVEAQYKWGLESVNQGQTKQKSKWQRGYVTLRSGQKLEG